MLYIFAFPFAFLLNQKQQKYFPSSLIVSLDSCLVLFVSFLFLSSA